MSISVKPFLLLSTHDEDAATHIEHLSFVRRCVLAPTKPHQFRLEQSRPTNLDLDNYSGVVVGGGPFNAPDDDKNYLQKEVETWFENLLVEVLEQDFPFFGTRYGVGLPGAAGHGRVSRRHGEQAAVVGVATTPDGESDPILEGLPPHFHAIIGHKETIEELPGDTTLLAIEKDRPMQMFRSSRNAYATQFHPELNTNTFIQYLQIYTNQGYHLSETDLEAVSAARQLDVARSGRILQNFVRPRTACRD